jgi:hypothetical protein
MTPFTANMKLHYQCRILFFYYASCLVGFLGPFALFFSRKAAGSGMYASSILLFPYLIGSLPPGIGCRFQLHFDGAGKV